MIEDRASMIHMCIHCGKIFFENQAKVICQDQILRSHFIFKKKNKKTAVTVA